MIFLFKFKFRFPGAKATDDVPNLLKLFLSKDPDSSIRTQVALVGGYDACNVDQNLTYHRKRCARDNNIWSEENLSCYKVLNVSTNFNNGYNNICNQSLIDIQNDDDVEAFINLVKYGTYNY